MGILDKLRDAVVGPFKAARDYSEAQRIKRGDPQMGHIIGGKTVLPDEYVSTTITDARKRQHRMDGNTPSNA